MLHSNYDDKKCDIITITITTIITIVTTIRIIIIMVVIILMIIIVLIILVMRMIVTMIIVLRAHDELGTCRTRLVSPKLSVLCIPACMLHGSLFRRL